MLSSPERLSKRSRAMVAAAENELVLSAASGWEIAIKHALSKLMLPEPPVEYISQLMTGTGITPLPVYHRHALHVATLLAHHADPFDAINCALAGVLCAPHNEGPRRTSAAEPAHSFESSRSYRNVARQSTFTVGSKRQCRANVYAFQVGKVCEYFILGHSAGQVVKDVVHRDAQPTQARLPAALSRLNGDSGSVVDAQTLPSCRASARTG
jgi:PIN domain nuclease of toxin-antitoxin system